MRSPDDKNKAALYIIALFLVMQAILSSSLSAITGEKGLIYNVSIFATIGLVVSLLAGEKMNAVFLFIVVISAAAIYIIS